MDPGYHVTLGEWCKKESKSKLQKVIKGSIVVDPIFPWLNKSSHLYGSGFIN